MFITIPKVFASMGLGTLVGILFFLLVLCAALTSSIALTESAVSTFQDELKWSRKKSTVLVGVIMITLGSLSSLGYGPLACVKIIGMQFLDFFDFLTNSVMMPIAAIATCLLVSRVIGVKRSRKKFFLKKVPSEEKDLQFYDPVSLPDLCSDHSDQFRGECIWMDFHVKNGGETIGLAPTFILLADNAY